MGPTNMMISKWTCGMIGTITMLLYSWTKHDNTISIHIFNLVCFFFNLVAWVCKFRILGVPGGGTTLAIPFMIHTSN